VKALALDLGASGDKFLSGSFDGESLEVREVHRFHNEPFEKGRHLYWDIHKRISLAKREWSPSQFVL
jgi:rhamnulokinase